MNFESILGAVIGGIITTLIIAISVFIWRFLSLKRADKLAEKNLDSVFTYIGCIFPEKEFGIILTNTTATLIVIREAMVLDEDGSEFHLASRDPATHSSPFPMFRKEQRLLSETTLDELGHLPQDVILIPPYSQKTFTVPYKHLDAMELTPANCKFSVEYQLPSGKKLLKSIQTSDQANKTLKIQRRLRESPSNDDEIASDTSK